MAKLLVVGGAGYVGSAVTVWLKDQGHFVWILDNLSTGQRCLALGDGFTLADCGNQAILAPLLEEHGFDCVFHFAGSSIVSESVRKPEEYHQNNVVQSRRLIECLSAHGVKKFVFSSTCAIFGDPDGLEISESLPKKPLNPYGQNKLEVEEILEEYASKHSLQAIALRYFNACGAEPKLRVGEWHTLETHLIPRVLCSALENQPIDIYGTDYPTPDGTCIRDYIHVWDLAEAHGKAMERLLALPTEGPGLFEAFNLGSEKGYSVKEVIRATEQVTGKPIQVKEQERRPGDPPRLVANSELAKRALGFGHRLLDLKEVIQSAYDWELKRRQIHRPAVFLDRDGTINEDPGYLHSPGQMKLLPHSGEALAQLRKMGFLLVVVSNQSGVGRGLIEERMLTQIHHKLDDLLKTWNVRIDLYEVCIHHPDALCSCRKPMPTLLLTGARKLQIDLSQSYMVGDKISDIGAGIAAGCKASILLKTGTGIEACESPEAKKATVICEDLLEAARWIEQQTAP